MKTYCLSRQPSLFLLNQLLVMARCSVRAGWMSSSGSTTEQSKATSRTSWATRFYGADEPAWMEASDTVASKPQMASKGAQQLLGGTYLERKIIAPFYWKLRTNIRRRRTREQLRMNVNRILLLQVTIIQVNVCYNFNLIYFKYSLDDSEGPTSSKRQRKSAGIV